MKSSPPPLPERPPAAAPSIRLTLPYPPSLNLMYRAVNGRNILSRVGRAYKQRVEGVTLRLLNNAYPELEGDVRVKLAFYRPAKRGDLDNSLKATLDALSGLAYRDDCQVQHIDAERFEDKANPRVEVLVERVAASGRAGVTQP